MEDWTYIPSSWLLSRTFPADLNVKIISGLARNCYLTFPNIVAAAKARDIQLVQIGPHRKSQSGRAARTDKSGSSRAVPRDPKTPTEDQGMCLPSKVVAVTAMVPASPLPQRSARRCLPTACRWLAAAAAAAVADSSEMLDCCPRRRQRRTHRTSAEMCNIPALPLLQLSAPASHRLQTACCWCAAAAAAAADSSELKDCCPLRRTRRPVTHLTSAEI